MPPTHYKELLKNEHIMCPKCGSQHIITKRGELTAGTHSTSECRCHSCDCDFLVSNTMTDEEK